MLHIMSRVEFK